jgi:hypothetical protein
VTFISEDELSLILKLIVIFSDGTVGMFWQLLLFNLLFVNYSSVMAEYL